jgi:hypothetical protein
VDIEATRSDVGVVILVEVKELETVPSPVEAWAAALGKYLLNRVALDYANVEIPLYLAVSRAAHENILSEPIRQRAIEIAQVSLVVFELEEIVA